MLDLRVETAPIAHLRVHLSGHLRVETFDDLGAIAAFERLTGPRGTPATVVVEVAPGTQAAPLAEGVLHFALRRLLAAGTDVRVVGRVRFWTDSHPAYLRAAIARGAVRIFATLADALAGPPPGAATGPRKAFA